MSYGVGEGWESWSAQHNEACRLPEKHRFGIAPAEEGSTV